MNRVAHQAIGENLHTVSFTILLQPDEIGPAVRIRKKEDILTKVPALRHVMGGPGKDRSRYPRHTCSPNSGDGHSDKGCVPFNDLSSQDLAPTGVLLEQRP